MLHYALRYYLITYSFELTVRSVFTLSSYSFLFLLFSFFFLVSSLRSFAASAVSRVILSCFSCIFPLFSDVSAVVMGMVFALCSLFLFHRSLEG